MARPLARDICVLIIIGPTDIPFWLPSAFVLGIGCELIREACCLGCVNILLCNEELCSAKEGSLEHVTSPTLGYSLRYWWTFSGSRRAELWVMVNLCASR
jgi:hypothetical protein